MNRARVARRCSSASIITILHARSARGNALKRSKTEIRRKMIELSHLRWRDAELRIPGCAPDRASGRAEAVYGSRKPGCRAASPASQS